MKDIYRNEVAALSKEKYQKLPAAAIPPSDQPHLKRRALDEHEITTH